MLTSSVSRRSMMMLRAALAGLMAFALITGSGAVAAVDLTRRMQFDIAPQALTTALVQFSKQAGVQFTAPGSSLTGVETGGVQGEYSADGALSLLLKDTGFTFRFVDDGTVAIQSARVSEQAATGEPGERGKRGNSPLVLTQTESSGMEQEGGQSESNDRQDESDREQESKGKLEEIVVTAERREESIQSLPIAISAFSGETLDNRGIGGLESLPQLAPSLQVGNKPGVEARVSMRGVSTELDNLGGEPAVAMTWDGVSYATAHLYSGDFFDIERVEVLRGPQGTISGRNATAGAIHIHSKRPTEEFEGRLKAIIGSYDRLALEGNLSGPIIQDRLLGRFAVRTDRADGWVTNTLLGEELGSVDKVQARASFLAYLSDNLEAHLILEGLRDRSLYFYSVVDAERVRPDTPSVIEVLGVPTFDRGRRSVQLDNPVNFDKDRYQATLRLTWDLTPSARLTSITSYVDQDAFQVHDNDSLAIPVIVFPPKGVSTGTWQVLQEVTLTADLTDRLDVIAGGIYLHLDQRRFIDNELPTLGIPLGALPLLADQTLTSWAGYTQWRYRLIDDIRLTAGVRYTHDSKKLTDRSLIFGMPLFADGDKSWSTWTPRFAVDYMTDDLTVYASVSRGFKSGGFDTFSHLAGGPVSQFEPEYIWSYEAGVKANWVEGRLKTALTGFYMDYTDLQQSLWDPEAGIIVARVTNAKSATIAGVELELDALVTDRFRINFTGTWLDATYDELRSHDSLFPELGVPTGGVNVRDVSDNRLVRSPEWQFNVAGEYRVPLDLGFLDGDLQGVLRASYAWQDKVYFDFFNHESVSQNAYGLLNLFGAIETRDSRWQLSAHVYNLTDKFYTTHGENVVGLTPVPYSMSWYGQPRTYSVSLAYRF